MGCPLVGARERTDQGSTDRFAPLPLIHGEGSPSRCEVDGCVHDIAWHASVLELRQGKARSQTQASSAARRSLVYWSRRRCMAASLVSVASPRTSTHGTASRCIPTVPMRAAIPNGIAGNAFLATEE
jgi:hypothetical protein